MKKTKTFHECDNHVLIKTFRIMRITVFLLLVSILQTYATDAYSQKTKISLEFSGTKLVEVLDEIEERSEFFFLYNEKLVDTDREVSVSFEHKRIDEILDKLFQDTDVVYTISDRKIILAPEYLSKDLQQKTISGKVSDEDGQPLPGVTVLIKGTSQGTVTKVDGSYDISNVPDGATLQFSFVGMLTKEIEVGTQTEINVILVMDAIGIEEVVAIGYGIKKKSDVISSVVSVSAEALNDVPTIDIGEMLKGKAAGVFVTLGDAGPGGSSNILIRGKNSINGGNNPIVIADGVPVGSINDINPNDIESMEILKDAAAQAIYGARASNGVILITTKRGKTGKAVVNYQGYYGAQTISRNFDVYDGDEFAQYKREAYRNSNGGEYMPDEQIFSELELASIQNGEYINWEDEILRVAPIQNHNISVATGSENSKLYSSFNYANQQGVVPGTDFEKLTIRINYDQKVNDWFSIGANTSWIISKNNDPGTGGTLQRMITTPPLGKIYDDQGELLLNPSGFQESFNPLLDLETTSNLKKNQSGIMNVFIDIKPFKNFKYRLNASRRSWNSRTQSYSTAESYAGVKNGGYGEGNTTFPETIEWQLENIVNYDIEKSLNKINLTFVQSLSERKYDNFRNEASFFPNDILGIYGLEAAEINMPFISANNRSLTSFVGRIQYDYDSRYYLTASARADGSSVFGANNKWGYFPAVAVGWNVYREEFLSSVDLVSNLKLRASYGSVGNEAIAPYQSQSTAVQRDYIFDGSKRSGYIPGAFLPNPNLKWETSTTLNTAIDFGLWKNRLSGTFEFYNTRTTDLLVNQALSAGLGYSMMKSNLGEIENQGIEFTLNGVIIDKKDFSFNAGVSFSKNKNEIISLYGLDEDGDGIEDDDVGNKWFIGQPIDVYYQYQYVGIFQEGEDIASTHQPDAEPGMIKLYDRYPDDGELNSDDRVITKADPDWYGSFNIDLTYKNFDFSAYAMTVQGVMKYNPYYSSYNYGGSMRGLLNGIKQHYWTPEDPTGNWPRPLEATDTPNISVMGLADASYFRLSNITLGYTLPGSVLSKMKLSKLRIYCTAHNPLTLTDYKSYSPEKNPGSYPEAVSVVGGLQVTF